MAGWTRRWPGSCGIRKKQNARLKKLVADQALDIQILQGGGTPKLVSPERRRRTVRQVRRRLGHGKVSERRTCKALRQARSTQRYHPRRMELDLQPLQAMRRITEDRTRFGCERVPDAESVRLVGRLRTRPSIMEAGTHAGACTQHKRRRLPGHSGNGRVRRRATHRNHVWTYDFLTKRTQDGRRFKLLVVLDEFTREALAIEAGRSFTDRDVILTLQFLFCRLWSTAAHSIRQRPGVHCQEYPAWSGTGGGEYPLHQQGQPVYPKGRNSMGSIVPFCDFLGWQGLQVTSEADRPKRNSCDLPLATSSHLEQK